MIATRKKIVLMDLIVLDVASAYVVEVEFENYRLEK